MLITHAKLWPVVEAALPRLASALTIILVGDDAPDSASNIISYSDVVDGQSSEAPHAHIDPDQLAALPYSSGTTGLPKGVMLTHRNLAINHEQWGSMLQLGPDDCYIIYQPLSHIYGVTMMGVSVRSGSKQILLERFDLEAVVRLIEEHGVTWLFAVPPTLLTLANAPGLDASQFRTVKYAFSAASHVGRGRRDRRARPASHEGLLERAGRNRARFAQWLALHWRHRPGGRRGVYLHRRPQKGDDQIQEFQHRAG
jgi:long-chain acyl-CoA synthetase